MRRDTTRSASPPTLADVASSAIGYALVAVACTLAGHSVARHFPWAGREWKEFMLLWALLFPAYVSRSALYEWTKRRFMDSEAGASSWQKTALAIQYPAVWLAFAVVGGLLVEPAMNTQVRIAATCAPMYALSIYLVSRWPRDVSLHDFRFRNFFPALATCLPTFVFGFTSGEDVKCPILAGGLVIAAWIIGLRVPTRKYARYAFLVFLILVFVFLWRSVRPQTNCLELIVFGLLMTLAMGVCEAWRFTTRILNDIEYRPGEAYGDSDKRYYLGGTNIATSLFLPFFLLTGLHPSTTRLYIPSVTLLLTLQYAAWFLDRTATKRTWWPLVGTISGFAFTVIIAIGTSIGGTPTYTAKGHIMELGTLASILGVLLVVGSYLVGSTNILALRGTPRMVEHFQSAIACIAITGLTAVGLCSILASGMLLLNDVISTPMASRISLLITTYFVIGIICAIVVYIARATARPEKDRIDRDAASNGAPRNNSMPRILLALVMSGRPPTAATAALISFVTVTAATHVYDIGPALASSLSIAALTMFGFVINDIFDRQKDANAGVRRPIAMGVISVPVATCFAMFLGIVAIAISLQFGGAIVVSLALLALTLYTPVAHAIPTVKGLYTAGLCLVPLWYANAIAGAAFNLLAVVSLVTFIFGREILLDVEDVAGDAAWGLKTVPVVVGLSRAAICAEMLMCGGAVALVFAAGTNGGRVASTAGLAVLLCVLAQRRPLHQKIRYTRLAMLCGAVAIALCAQ